jgi:hypothetical protein
MKRIIFTVAVIFLFSSIAYALDPVGEYSYKEKGYSGKMTITEVPPIPLTWEVIIDTASNTGHTCKVKAKGNSMISSDKEIEALFPFIHGVDKSLLFTVKFTPEGALIDVTDSGQACGLNGSFGGKWVKTSAKKGGRK